MTTLAGVDMLGYTYDVLGKYADSSYIQHLVVPGIQDAEETKTFEYDNLDDAVYGYPATCEVFSSTPESSDFQTSGSSYEEFSRSTEAQMGIEGSYGGFSGSIDAAYSESVRSSSSYYYSSILEAVSGFVLRIKDENLALSAAVQADVDDPAVDPETVFSRWGTHVVTGVVVGGQCRYWSYGSKETFAEESDFTVAAGASYAGASGSGKYSESSSQQSDEVRTSSGLEVLGGTTAGRAAVDGEPEGFDVWSSTIPYQPAVIGFPYGDLRPLWKFCSDAARAQELEDAFDRLYVPMRGEAAWRYVEGSSADGTIEVKTDDPGLFAVGFRGNVDTNNNLNRFGVQFEDVGGVRHWLPNETGSFEKSGSVPEGCALTGIALHVEDDTLKHLKLYYQHVNRGHSTNDGSALERTVHVMYVGGEHSGWDLDSLTSSNNRKAMGGFQVRLTSGEGRTLGQYESEFLIEGDQE